MPHDLDSVPFGPCSHSAGRTELTCLIMANSLMICPTSKCSMLSQAISIWRSGDLTLTANMAFLSASRDILCIDCVATDQQHRSSGEV